VTEYLILWRQNHRRRSGCNSGGTHGEGRRWIDAEWGRVYGKGCPLFSRLGGLCMGALWAPPVGCGAEPRSKTDFGVFWRPQKAHFCTYMTKSAGDNLHYRPPTPNSGGTCPPVPPPWSTPIVRTAGVHL